MKKFLKISATVITVLLVAAGFIWYYPQTKYEPIAKGQQNYQAFKLLEPEKMDVVPTEALEQITRRENLLSEKGKTIERTYFSLESIEPKSKTHEPYLKLDRFTLGNEIYFVSTTVDATITGTIYHFTHNNQEFLSEELCGLADFQQVYSFEKIGTETVLYFNQGPCQTISINGASADRGHENIFFRDQRFSETYSVSSSRSLFIYQNKIGFIGTRNNQEFVFLNGQPISLAYNRIIDDACCAAPRYWQLYDNGALVFMAMSDTVNETYMVEIDLNKYLEL